MNVVRRVPVKVMMKRQEAVHTHLVVPGVSTTMAASLLEAKFQESSDFRTNHW